MDQSESELLHDVSIRMTTTNESETAELSNEGEAKVEAKLEQQQEDNVDANPSCCSLPETVDEEELESPELQIGDHVYQWRSILGIPYMFQHHGIVMDVLKDENEKPTKLIIADFSNVETKDDKAKKDSKKDSKKESKKSDTITNDDDGIKSSDTNTREEPIHRNKEESDTEMAELPLQKDDNNIKDDGNDAAASKQKDTRRKSRMSSLQQLKSL